MFGRCVGIFIRLLSPRGIIPVDQLVAPIVLGVGGSWNYVQSYALFPLSQLQCYGRGSTVGFRVVGIPLINFCFCTGDTVPADAVPPFLVPADPFRLIFFRRYSERRYKKIFGATASAGYGKKREQ